MTERGETAVDANSFGEILEPEMELKEITGVQGGKQPDKLDDREDHFFMPGPVTGLRLFLRYLGPGATASKLAPVLYVHGMSFPLPIALRGGPGVTNCAMPA